ncbi:hypothetical protein CROQUDRAFT_135608 [Cronartium quercuum f. sp. fusiforme G11]|uniref:Coatomer subunit alpha n=1 Tax=Cronartium quercuum f. sp. fusiforme G11 TaxID=708437 RepID=A0A9P6T8B4_9BASI|nr:hypothetical protein CROQUDRAFT_135608 [Cronartium quercuum f. sp. fusiforme G11]
MQMLTKFESKSNRVKGIAFHPKLTLLAASLHSGSIQMWNFQMGTLVERFDEHDGPVRGIAFHPSQPLFVSGGDDYKIKVWNYKQRRCLFTLHGHLDYVRSVSFHREHPWILSASDDQTIRIWNWQSRQCIAILTGHNHYIMYAEFHPKDDYIVSCSMDQTVRVWDITGLRKKTTTAQPMSFEDQVQRANSGQADLFGNTDAVVKYVLEGHDRGVNWATFHPTLPLIVSCGDDRQIKLWRMSETKAWEVDTCRGHFNNISAVLFHPKHELIISDSEDKTIRVWDMSKRTAVQTFRRENDRFWVLTSHPELNLFAAGHDTGLIVFKLDRERPAFNLNSNTLFYVRDKYVRVHDLTTGSDVSVISVKKLGSQYVQPRTLSYNPAERAVLVTSPAENGIYELIHLPKDLAAGEVRDSSSEGKRGVGQAALFVARNRFAVLDKTAQTIEIRDLSNAVTKTMKCPPSAGPVHDLFYGGTATLLLSTPTAVILFDIQQQKSVAELTTPPVKYVVWSNDGAMVALLSKHTIVIANKSLGQSSLIHETIRIKSGAWDDSGIFVYSTLNHIKYALPQGDNGIIKTLDQPVYLTRVKGKMVHCLDRNAKPKAIAIDPTEYRFKLALVRKNYDEVLHIIRTSNLVGQSIIAYLQKKGFPEIALHFVQDKTTRFDLAIECGNLDVALETAKAIDRPESWSRLGQQALKQGHQKIVEIAYQRTKAFDRLSFLYLITANTEKLGKMAKIAEMRADPMSKFHNALYSGAVQTRIAVLKDVGLYPLAYLTAKSNGLEEEAQGILEEAGMSETDVADLPVPKADRLGLPNAITPTADYNWPFVGAQESFFDRALTQASGMDVDGEPVETQAADPLDDWVGDEQGGAAAAEEAEEAWDLAGEDLAVEEAGAEGVEAEEGEGADGEVKVGVGEQELWVRNSPLAADHVAAGSFETAMQLLNRQAGVVEFGPLKDLFLATYRSSRAYLPASASLAPLEVCLRRDPEDVHPRSLLPVLARSLESLTRFELKAAYAHFRKAEFVEASGAFRRILQSLLLVIAKDEAEVTELSELVITCREYLLGLSLEIERRRVAATEPENLKRQLELAAYFTHCGLQPVHLILALRLAMTTFSKAKNLATAAAFSKRLLDLNPAANVASQAKQVLAAGDRSPRDAIEIDYDPFSSFDVCPGSLTPIPAGSAFVDEPFTGARYKSEFAGSVCKLSGLTEVGKKAAGVRWKI